MDVHYCVLLFMVVRCVLLCVEVRCVLLCVEELRQEFVQLVHHKTTRRGISEYLWITLRASIYNAAYVLDAMFQIHYLKIRYRKK